MLEALVREGLDVVRLNFSHGTHASHGRIIERTRAVSERLGVPVAVMQDLMGPRVRIGGFAAASVELREGAAFCITTRDVAGDETCVRTRYPMLPHDVKAGDHILLDDGVIDLEVIATTEADVRCTVIAGGTLRSNAGMNLPGVDISEPSVTEKDLADLAFGIERGVDYVALSFVRCAEDIETARAFMTERGVSIPIIAKIEKPEAVSGLAAILDAADGIMIARGDLGVEMLTEQVPLIQKDIIGACQRAGKPVITATQMLESMTHSPRPTRAEASDVANAILDGTDAVMLSEETSIGQYPVESVRMMERIVEEAQGRAPSLMAIGHEPDPENITFAAADAACHAAESIGARAIVVYTHSGATARIVAQRRPRAHIFALTPDDATYRRLALVWGVVPMRTEVGQSIDAMFDHGRKLLLESGPLEKDDPVVVLAGTSLLSGATNLVMVQRL